MILSNIHDFFQVNNDVEELLGHKLVLALIKEKWKDIGRAGYYFRFVAHIVFVVFLTAFAFFVPSPYAM